ncbi:hypothetical protein NY78_4274 [Desulfovibrio sp. TomC]|nr:hypothetical protein NY78_4274 [Desulfovibrio sp. TomC]
MLFNIRKTNCIHVFFFMRKMCYSIFTKFMETFFDYIAVICFD